MYSGIIAVYMRDVTQKPKENSSFLILIKYLFTREKLNIWPGRCADIKQLCIFMRKITESLENRRTPPVTAVNVKDGCIPQLLPNAGAGE